MDKINLANWGNLFSKADQQVVFHSARYADVQFQFDERGLACGALQSISVPGMQLTEISVQAESQFCLVDEPKETVESVFVLEGTAESIFANLSRPLSFRKGQHNLQYNEYFGGEHIVSPKFHALSITYDLDFLHELFAADDDPAIVQLAKSIAKKNTYLATRNALQWQGRIAEVITSIRSCTFSGATKYLFLESKMMELFVLQLEQAKEAICVKYKEEWSAADRESLRAVKDYIENNYLETFSLTHLTYRFGLNEFKLKKGFKQLFGSTVFGYLYQLRMQKAQEMLKQKTANVSEAAFFIGYNNVSSFCTEFKKRFGYSPGKIQNY